MNRSVQLISISFACAATILGCNSSAKSGSDVDTQPNNAQALNKEANSGPAPGAGSKQLSGTWIQTNANRGSQVVWEFDPDGKYTSVMAGANDPHLGTYKIVVKGLYTEGDGKITQQFTFMQGKASNPEAQKEFDAKMNNVDVTKSERISGTTEWQDKDHVTIKITRPADELYVLRRKAVVQ